MDKIWLRSYPAGVPPDIDLEEYTSINDMASSAFRRYGERPAFRNFGATVTFAQVDGWSRDLAAWLQNLPGLQRRSRVAIMMPNLIQYPIALFGVLRAGMIVVNVNPLYTARELKHQLQDSGAEAIIILENFAHVLQSVLGDTPVKYVITTQLGDCLAGSKRWLTNFVVKRIKKMVPPWKIAEAAPFRTALNQGAALSWKEPVIEPEDIAFLQYTGGTTGLSKGAMLSHRNVVANVLQGVAWTSPALEERRETLVTALPLYHIFALTTNLLLCMEIGGLNILVTNPRDLPAFIHLLKRTPFTVLVGVNTLFNALLHQPEFASLNFTGLKFALGGGAAVQPAVASAWERATGRPMVQGYGLTEASPFVSCNRFDQPYNGTVGVPLPSTEVSIVDNDGRELDTGGEGEICVRGPQVMAGYWQQPAETSKVITPGGWLRTGDIGLFDQEGRLRITDRKKDMILVSGFNVFPNEVESVLAGHPSISECAVIGIPDAVTGEAVKAFIVAKDSDLTPEAIIAFCRQSLTNYKVPKHIEFRSSLPKNPIGKVLRRELRPAGADTRADIASVPNAN
jgi:long-chain acyl-CoA synthetase